MNEDKTKDCLIECNKRFQKKCTTCDNPECCNCPNYRGPCSGGCALSCPGDFEACCFK